MEDVFKTATLWLATAIEACAAVVIAAAAARAGGRSAAVFAAGAEAEQSSESVRLQLGRWLALALEFELAADILRTAVTPTWNEIGQLAAIVILRTALNFFLQREIDAALQRKTPAEAASEETHVGCAASD